MAIAKSPKEKLGISATLLNGILIPTSKIKNLLKFISDSVFSLILNESNRFSIFAKIKHLFGST
jgi:hypothetical protein